MHYLDLVLASFPTNPATGTAGVYIGDLFVDTCEEAVRILSHLTVIDPAFWMANDAAYKLAAQLLAARLNVQSGAVTCGTAAWAMETGQALLDELDFEGVLAHLKPGYLASKSPQRKLAEKLAKILDAYNNGKLC